ncbi:MAG: hydrolase, partial [Rhizobium pusense]|nr:hydrolase [Agrobacterium pusense]
MNQALYIVDVQPSFNPPATLVAEISSLAQTMPSLATVERHDESVTPFERQLGWKPGRDDESLVVADRIFIKHGYAQPREAID